MIELNTNPTAGALRAFGLLFLLFFGLLGGLLHGKGMSLDGVAVIWLAAAAIGLFGQWRLAIMRYVYLAMLYLSYPVGLIVSHALMLIIYYLILTPMGCVIQLAGRDSLNRKKKNTQSSYWKHIEKNDNMDRYFRQS